MRPGRLALSLGLSLALFACHPQSSNPDAGAAPGAKVTPPKTGEAKYLKPLPEPPKLDIKKEALPGAGGALEVVVARPQGHVEGVVRPTVTFSKPVMSLGMVEAQKAQGGEKPLASIDPPLEGEWHWLGSSSAQFVPKAQVPYSTRYTVTVHKGLRAIDGSELKSDYVFNFSTPTLAVQRISPEENYPWLKPQQQITVVLNQPVKVDELEKLASFAVGGEDAPYRVQVLSQTSIEEERRKEAEKAGRAWQPLGGEEGAFENQQVRYVLAPEKPFPFDREVALRLPGGLHAEQGPLPMGRTAVYHFHVFGALLFTGAQACLGSTHCPTGPLILFTTNRVDLESLKSRLTITPNVAIDWDETRVFSAPIERRAVVAVQAAFKPGTRYEVKIRHGVKDEFGQTAVGYSAEIHTSDLDPALSTGGPLAMVEAAQGPSFPVQVTNLRSLKLALWKLTPQEAASWLAQPPYKRKPLGRPADVVSNPPLELSWNETHRYPVDLTPVMKKSGLALVQVSSPNLREQPELSFVQVTDLAVHTQIGAKSSLAWVTRLSNGEPVPGAKVQLFDKAGNLLFTGTSGADGLADLPGTAALKLPEVQTWETPYLLVAASVGEDTGIVTDNWAQGIEPYEFGLTANWVGNLPQAAGLIFPERGIYRPGETVELKGVLRYRQLGELKLPQQGSTLKLTVTDERGQKVLAVPVTLSAYGTFHQTVHLSGTASLGTYSVTASGQIAGKPIETYGDFRVAEYRAPQFKVDVESPKKELVSGEPLQATVLARYLFGGAMSDAPVSWSVVKDAASFAPETVPGYQFGPDGWIDQGDDTFGLFASGKGAADEKGALAVGAGHTEARSGPVRYTVEAEVTDVNRQSVVGRTSVVVHPASIYVGLKPPLGFATAGQSTRVDTVVVDLQGARVAGKPIQAEVIQRTWTSIQKKDATGGFVAETQPVDKKISDCALKSADVAVPCVFTPPQPGVYLVRATVQDDQGRKQTSSASLYAVGSGWFAWGRADTDRIDLLPDKKRYSVGEVAHVLVKSPYPTARALFTVERDGIRQRKVVSLEGSANTLDVPITEDMVPNVFVSVVLMHARTAKGGTETGVDPNRPAVKVGMVELPVEQTTKRLTVTVKPESPQHLPGEEVNLDINVRDAAGQPAPAELTVYAVDEAVLRLTDYHAPDPLQSIYPEQALAVRFGEPMLHLVGARNYGEKGEDEGGGGSSRTAGGIAMRSNFRTTAFYDPAVIAGDNGYAHVRFKLPDNLTTYRIMAVAVGPKDRFGVGHAAVEVHKPLLALAALPRFARVGDHFEAGVVVHSHGSGAGEASVTASVDGARLDGPSVQTVQVSESAPREVRFSFTATDPGTATFRFTVQRAEYSDGLIQKIPILLPVEPETVATYGDTQGKQQEAIDIPQGVMPGVGGLSVTLASTALGNFGQGMQQLVEYPYGCLEQQASRLVPFVALRGIAGQFGLAWTGMDDKKRDQQHTLNQFFKDFLFDPLDVTAEADPDAIVRETVASIVKLQADNGAFRYWADDACPDSWTSAYATLALARAKEVGYPVNPEVVNRAQAFVEQVAGGQCLPCEYSCPVDTQVFASWVLARTGTPRPSLYGNFYRQRGNLSLFDTALLADAMFVGGGDRAQARTLLQQLLNHARETPQGVHFEETVEGTYAPRWDSDTRTTGLVLETLTDIQPDHPYVSKIAHYLQSVRQGDGKWRNTQEAAFSLMGLTELLRTKEKATPNFDATVALGDKQVAQGGFHGRSMAVQEAKVPMQALLMNAGKQPLSFSKQGDGVLYYSASLKYAPKTVPMQPVERGVFVQRWFEPYAGGGQSTHFFAGDLVRVRLRVATTQSLDWTAFEVPLPAGLEAVDTSLASSAHQAQGMGDQGRGEGYDAESAADQVSGTAGADNPNQWMDRFYSPFNHTEMHDSQVVLFADHLPPGVHVASFVARATTPGTFVLQPAHGEEMYSPEVFGRSSGGTFVIETPKPVSER